MTVFLFSLLGQLLLILVVLCVLTGLALLCNAIAEKADDLRARWRERAARQNRKS